MDGEARATGNGLIPPGDNDWDRAKTILVVEDEVQVRRVVCLTLEKQGYRWLAAENAEQALELAAVEDHSIELLLTDVVLPGMSGPQLYEALRCTRENVRVLFMSGYADEVLTAHDVSSTEAHFLAKPFSSAMLGRKLRQVVEDEPMSGATPPEQLSELRTKK